MDGYLDSSFDGKPDLINDLHLFGGNSNTISLRPSPRYQHKAADIQTPNGSIHVQTGYSQAPNYNPGTDLYIQYTNFQNTVKSFTSYNEYGYANIRVDLRGRPHKGLLPHIHVFNYYLPGKPNNESVHAIIDIQIAK